MCKNNLSTNDVVNRPAHYTDGKIEVIEYIEDKKLGFCLGNAIKYISRAGKKDPTKEVEDLKKAIWYIERRIKQLECVEKKNKARETRNHDRTRGDKVYRKCLKRVDVVARTPYGISTEPQDNFSENKGSFRK